MKKNSNRPFLRKLRRSLLVLLIVFTSLFLIAFVSAWIFEERVKGIIVNQLNKNLTAKVDVEEIELSLIRKFPFASLDFQNARISSGLDTSQTFIKAEHLFLQFSLIDLIDGKYEIKRMDLTHANVFIYIDSQGRENYMIWKSSDKDTVQTSSEDFQFDLSKLRFQDVLIEYKDKKRDVAFEVTAYDASMKGSFSESIYDMGLKGDFLFHHFQSGNFGLFNDDQANLSIKLNIDNSKGLYTIEDGKLNLSNLPFLVDGTITNTSDDQSLQLSINGDGLSIDKFVDQLPKEYVESLEDYKMDGSVKFEALINGDYSSGNVPDMRILFSVNEGSIVHSESNTGITSIGFNGEVNGQSGGRMMLKDFYGRLGNGQVNGYFQLNNFSDPVLKAVLHSELNLNELMNFFPNDTIQNVEGSMMFKLSMKTKLSASAGLSVQDFLNSTTSGQLSIRDGGFELKGDNRKFHGINGRFSFNNNDLVTKNLALNIDNSQFLFKGYFMNFLPYLMLQDQSMQLKGSLQSKSVDINDLLATSTETDSKDDEEGADKELKFPDRITAKMDFKVQKLKYNKFEGRNVSGKLSLNGQKLYVQSLSMNTLDGKIQAKGLLEVKNNKEIEVNCQAEFRNLDAQKTFYAFNNFGQKALLSENIRGKVTSRIDFLADLDKSFNVIMPSIKVNADVIINDGELINFETLEGLSGFVRAGDLSHVKFSTLKNQIQISNEQVIIPEMMIRSDAINLNLSGVQDFDGGMEYHLKLKLSELWSRKTKDANSSNEEFSADEEADGLLTVYLLIYGDVSDPKYKYDRKGLRETFSNNLKSEQNDLKEIFSKEFGQFSKEESERERREKEELRRHEAGEFIIQWDDEDEK